MESSIIILNCFIQKLLFLIINQVQMVSHLSSVFILHIICEFGFLFYKHVFFILVLVF